MRIVQGIDEPSNMFQMKAILRFTTCGFLRGTKKAALYRYRFIVTDLGYGEN